MKLDKKNRIVQAAALVFAQKGYNGASVADIAVQAGIGKGTVYEYFKSKEDLFFAVFQWFMQKTGAAATVSISVLGGSVTQRLEALNESLMRLWEDIRHIFALSMEFWAASSSSQMKERFKQAFRKGYGDFRLIVSSLIREGIRQGEFRADIDAEHIAAALVGTWDALLLQAWFDESFDPLKTSKNFLSVIIRGLLVERQAK